MNVFKLFGTVAINKDEAIKDLGQIDKKAEDTGGKLGGAFSKAGEGIKSTVGKVGSFVSTKLVAGAKWGGAAAGAALATSLWKGMGRLDAIEQAEAKLKGLGHSTESISVIMDNALASVKGTFFGLDEAAAMAATTVAAGIKPGEDLERVLRLTGDTAAIAGTSLSDMSSIYGKIITDQKLTGSTLSQLQDRGLPVLEMLADHLGITAEAARDMVSDGQISFEIFSEAMEKNLGGAAIAMGDTTSGAFKNMGAAASRFGANLLKNLFPRAKEVFTGITNWLDDIGPTAEKIGVIVGDALGKAADWVSDNWWRVQDTFSTLVGFWNAVLFPAVQRLVSIWVDVVQPAIGRVAQYLIGQSNSLADWWNRNYVKIKETVSVLVSVIKNAVDVLLTLWNTFGKNILDQVKTTWDYVKNTIENIMNLVRNIVELALNIITGDWGAAWSNVKNILATIWDQIKNLVSLAINTVKNILSAALNGIKATWSGIWNSIKTELSTTWATIKTTVSTSIDTVVGFFTSLPGRIRSAVSGLAGTILNPFSSAFNSIKNLWNNTVGKVSFSIPGWVPGLGGKGWSFPRMHTGGVVPGFPGQEVPVILQAGETVLPTQSVGEDFGTMMADLIGEVQALRAEVARGINQDMLLARTS